MAWASLLFNNFLDSLVGLETTKAVNILSIYNILRNFHRSVKPTSYLSELGITWTRFFNVITAMHLNLPAQSSLLTVVIILSLCYKDVWPCTCDVGKLEFVWYSMTYVLSSFCIIPKTYRHRQVVAQNFHLNGCEYNKIHRHKHWTSSGCDSRLWLRSQTAKQWFSIL